MTWRPTWLVHRLQNYSVLQEGLPLAERADFEPSQRENPLRWLGARCVPTRKFSIKTVIIVAAVLATLNFTWLHSTYKPFVIHPQPTVAGLIEPALSIREDDTHHVFRSKEPSSTDRSPLPIRAYDAMSNECVEQWVAHHDWGVECARTNLSDGLKVDGVWAWVNGSDPLQIASRQGHRPDGSMKMDAAHRYADHDELLFSMRSALESLGSNVMQRVHILASAYHMPNRSNDTMAGQVPAWLDKETALSGNSPVVLHHDANFYKPIAALESSMSPSEIEKWKDAVIPSFNSLAVESQIHNIDNTASDQLVYFNDDFFTLRKLAVSDYTTPLYGPVIKTFTRITSMYTPAENTWWRFINAAGEEVGIKRAAWVLGKRFSMRPYYYITHHPRTLWLPLLLEAAQTFPEAFSNTALSRFRAQSDVPVSIQTVFLGSWYIVERHREALLWTWAVAKWGGDEGYITPTLKEKMWVELANEPSPSHSFLSIRVPVRNPVENASLFETTGMDIPTSTEYSFSSKDGYALSYVESMWYWNRPKHGFPDLTQGLIQSEDDTAGQNETRFSKDPTYVSAKACTIPRSRCFGPPGMKETASDFFKRIAFEQPKCGDCIVTALIGVSGQSGIDAFLPHRDEEMQSGTHSGDFTEPPHLPLTPDWTTTDFSMASVIPNDSAKDRTTLRTWCLRLIQRYSYVLGSVSSDFYKVEKASSLESKLEEVSRKVEEDKINTSASSPKSPSELQHRWKHEMGENRDPLAFLCLNDDIKETGELRGRVDWLLDKFFRRMWTDRMVFERSS